MMCREAPRRSSSAFFCLQVAVCAALQVVVSRTGIEVRASLTCLLGSLGESVTVLSVAAFEVVSTLQLRLGWAPLWVRANVPCACCSYVTAELALASPL